MATTTINSDNFIEEEAKAKAKAENTKALASQVFGTVELLEKILLELPIRYLLLAQRVSRHWQRVIAGSKKLQQALFFEPIPVGPVRFFDDPKLFKNPLLSKIFGEIQSLEAEGYVQLEDRIYEGYGRDGYGRHPLHESWKEPSASWRKMYLTQPPAYRCFELNIMTDGDYEDEMQTFGVSRNTLTIGPIIRELDGLIRRRTFSGRQGWMPDMHTIQISYRFRDAQYMKRACDVVDLIKHYRSLPAKVGPRRDICTRAIGKESGCDEEDEAWRTESELGSDYKSEDSESDEESQPEDEFDYESDVEDGEQSEGDEGDEEEYEDEAEGG